MDHISYIFTTWSLAKEQEMPDQPQGSASKAFQLDKTICGSSYIASLNVVSAQTAQKSINSIYCKVLDSRITKNQNLCTVH